MGKITLAHTISEKRRHCKMKSIVTNSITKIYPGGNRAVNSLSLSLEQGEVYGFLGPNGAGKTTTVKLLTGMLSSSEGNCEVMGLDPSVEPEKVHAISGVVTEHSQMYDNLTGLENLLFYGSLFGLERSSAQTRGLYLLRQLGLDEAADRRLSDYSTGMRQRLSLARALIHHPEVLFLDEPTSGLDPESAQNVNRLIRDLALTEGVTIFLCTHQLRYAQEICTRYGLIEKGSLLASGTLGELRRTVSPRITVKIRADRISPDMISRLGLRRSESDGKGTTEIPDNSREESRATYRNEADKKAGKETGAVWLETEVASEEEIPGLVRRIVSEGGELFHVSACLPSLEDIYFSLTTGKGDLK